MKLFGRSSAPASKMVPYNHAAELCETFNLDRYAKFYGEEAPRWITEEEARREQEAWERDRPSVEELMRDPGVRAVVEAFALESVALDLESN